MSQRYGPTSDNRSTQDRSPQRNSAPSIHPSRISNVDQRPRDGIPDAPRGPRASTESFRSYGPPRGRGTSRGEHRQDFRDRESFRRGGSPPDSRRGDFRVGRAWSPSVDREGHRDYFDQPRDVEGGRGRGRYRDNAPGRFVEGRGSHSYYPPRDEGSRGRGQFYSQRGRGRGSYHDDRGSFRGRSPSPQGRNRWARSPSPRERRPSDRFEDDRFERRNSEKSHERDDRSRDDDRPRGPDRYAPRPSPTTPSSYRLPLSASRVTSEVERDSYQPRRRQSGSDVRERVYDSFRPDQSSKRDVTRVEQQHSSRPSSPPRPPEVPAFGSLPTKTPISEVSPWNKWIAPEQKQIHQQQRLPSPPARSPQPSSLPTEASSDEPSQPPDGASDTSKLAVRHQSLTTDLGVNALSKIASPKPEPQEFAPKAPRAQRREPSPIESEVSDAKSSSLKQDSPRLSTATVTQTPDLTTNAPPASVPKAALAPQEAPSVTLRSPPTGPRQLAGIPPGPKSSLSPLASRATLSSPGFNPPSGPRAGPLLSPKINPTVPTGPRAERATSVNARPPFVPSGPASWQWNRADPQLPNMKPLVVPAKREFDAERKAFLAPQTGNESHQLQGPQQSGDHAQDREQPLIEDGAPAKRQRLNIESFAQNERQVGPDAKTVDSASEEDAMDLDDDDIERREKRFQETKARLEAQKIDLSARHLRGCSPLRRLNLLSRLALEDLSTFFVTPTPRSRKPTTQRAISQQELKYPLPTEEISDVGQTDQSTPLPILRAPPEPKTVRRRSPSPISSPELASLPFLNNAPPTPLSDIDALKENLRRHEKMETALLRELQNRDEIEDDEEEELRDQYEDLYRSWKQQWNDLDAEHKDRDGIERQEQVEIAGPQSATEVSPPLPTPGESRRRGLHATDYELEKILEMSKLEAEQAAKEQQERDAVNAKPNWDVEASIPSLMHPRDIPVVQFADSSCLRDPRQMVMTWELDPEIDDFTQEEHETMLQNFKDFPKKFGKIAEGLEGRTYKDCINHYYATKWNGQYKPPRDKRRRAKVPRAKSGPNARPRANNLISNLDEDAKPDLYDGNDAAAPLNAYTDSGRPKRAAAPTFKEKEPQADTGPFTTPAKKSGKLEQSGDRTIEKTGRKRAPTSKEPRARKPRTQLVRRDSQSPEKMDTYVSALERQQSNARDLEGATSLASLGATPPSLLQRPSNAPAFSVEPSQSRAPMGPEAGKIQTVRSGHASGTSSYWSVQEVEIFPSLIEKYGTDWYAIAEQMGTKSHTMVKNYFNRLKIKNPEMDRVAKDADDKRQSSEFGSAGGSSSTPALASKRVKEPTVTSQVRPLAPTSTAEIIEIDDEDHALTNAPPSRNPPLEPVSQKFSRQDMLLPRDAHGEPGNSNRPFTSAPFQPSYAPISQPPFESRLYPQREPVVSAPTSASHQYGSISVPLEFGPVSNAEPSLSRPSYQAVRPGVEDVHYRAPRVNPPISRGDVPPSFSMAPSGLNPVPRPTVTERSMAEEMHHARQSRRVPSPPPHAAARPFLGDLSSRPPSTSFLDQMRNAAPRTLPREDQRVPSRGNAERPAPSAPAPPKRSTILSLLNDEPRDAPSQSSRPTSGSASQTVSKNPMPAQYGASASTGSYPPPPRPSSRSERSEYAPNDHLRRISLTSYQPSSHLQPSRPVVEPREGMKLHPGSFHIPWPPAEETAPPPPQPAQRLQQDPAPFDHRSTFRYFESRINPSPPPTYGPRDGGSGSGHSSPFNQRISLQHLNGRHESPPPARTYAYAAPSGAHSRDTSISHLNPERRAPPPSVLQPQHAPRSSLLQQTQIMQSGLASRADPAPAYAPREYASYTTADSVPPRSLYTRPSDLVEHERPPDPRFEAEKRGFAIQKSMREDDHERRPTDWTQGISREARYGPATGTSSGSGRTATPSQTQQPQYAPYHPSGESSGGR